MKKTFCGMSLAGWLWLALSVGQPARAKQAEPHFRELRLAVGRSLVMDFPADIARISTSTPEVVDAVAVSVREVLLNGKGQGTSTVVVWTKPTERHFYTVTVDVNLESIQSLVQETFPGMDIRVQAARDSVSLVGRVPSKEVSERAAALVAPLAKAVVNNLQIVTPGPDKQIVLRVKFAELNRSAANSFGVNLMSTGFLNTPALTGTGQFGLGHRPIDVAGAIPGQIEGTGSKFTITDALNIFAFRPDLNLSAFVKALQTQHLLQILAEPNLVTTNGKQASFLVGGEFPVPVVQGGASVGAVTVVFKEFGIRLSFEPLLTEHNTIKMFVKPEVSTIDLANAVVLSGFTIPALASRRMETHLELGVGQSFLIAGLLDERVTESLFRIPGLSHIPILGALFKSRQENKASTELIVMVTPEVTTPAAAAQLHPMPPMPREFLAPAKPGNSGRQKPAPGGKAPRR